MKTTIAVTPEPPSLAKTVNLMAASAAIAAPTLLGFNLPPSATFFNQAIALLGWGGWLLWLSGTLSRPQRRWSRVPRTWVLALLLLMLAALAAPLWAGQPWALSLSTLGLLGAALTVGLAADQINEAGQGVSVFRVFCIGLLVASAASTLIALIQVFAPQWADGDLIARSAVAGRAVGNLRQPNHLCTLLLWGMVALVWLHQIEVVGRRWALALALLMMLAVVLSASRSGVLGALLLAGWGALDKRLPARVRWALVLAPVAYAVLWAGTSAWSHLSHQAFTGEGRFTMAGDISSSRFGIWSNTLALIKANPWWGVGFGEFNFAWTLTPFPGRSVHFFDHAHNLPLHLAVELGLPLATLVMALLGYALWRAWQAGQQADAGPAGVARAAWVMVLMILVHSLLEYPLWYAYFLLPTAFALGLCLGLAPARAPTGAVSSGARLLAGAATTVAAAAQPAPPFPPQRTRPLLIGALLMVLGSVWSVQDYFRVVTIFTPGNSAVPLAERIADGQRSWFFSHHGDYAAVTTAAEPLPPTDPGWKGAPHYLLDARLMMAWAQAFEAAGDTQRARYVAQRLKEFRNPQSQEFFAPCAGVPATGVPTATSGEATAITAVSATPALPFQCLAPDKPLTYKDFR
jgi:O-antigen ligase